MKQILQNIKTGATEIAEVPSPLVSKGQILIRSSTTLVSAGTERMLVEFGKAGWINKARQQPEKVRMVVEKIKTDGLIPTIEAVKNKLDQPLTLGYCNAGIVMDVGSQINSIQTGDRVVSNGKHAEVVSVPENLCAKIPDSVSDDEASFTVLGSIALQGIRLAQPTLGECVVVIGLGLVGLLTVQLLKANGCRVLGLDYSPARLALAEKFGAEVVNLNKGEDPLTAAHHFSRGRGVDAVLITASTDSNEPVHQAALMCRKRGRIILVGVTGLELSRSDFYEKEITFQVSCSYGPGRYDSNYEERGFDYPIGFVRWTEQRNFEAVLDMLADGRLNVKPLITHQFEIAEAEKAYELIASSQPSLGVLLKYPATKVLNNEHIVHFKPAQNTATNQPSPRGISFIGSGNYSTAVLIPAFQKNGARLRNIASRAGVTGVHAGRKFGFEQTTTDTELIFSDTETSAVVITTQHNTHADFVIKALQAGKHVFVEKPLCLTLNDLEKVKSAYNSLLRTQKTPSILMVGFNRRFSPQVRKIKELLCGVKSPKAFVMTVNAGFIPGEHWTQNSEIGGGRLIGEACHFIDLIRFLAESPIKNYHTQKMSISTQDTATITLEFTDGSLGTIHYFSNGNKSFPKERLEIFCENKILQLDNFRKLVGFGWPNFKKLNLWKQDKGQLNCVREFIHAVNNGLPSPIPWEEIFEVSQITIESAKP